MTGNRAIRHGLFVSSIPIGKQREQRKSVVLTPEMSKWRVCAGDTIQVTPGGQGWVSFMYSYPMYLPLPAGQVARMRDTVQSWPYKFDRLYGGWFGKTIPADAQAAVVRSADRYIGILDDSIEKTYF